MSQTPNSGDIVIKKERQITSVICLSYLSFRYIIERKALNYPSRLRTLPPKDAGRFGNVIPPKLTCGFP